MLLVRAHGEHRIDLQPFPLLAGMDAESAATSFGSRLGLRSTVHLVRMTDPTIERRALSLVTGFESALTIVAALEPVNAAMSRIPASLISAAEIGPE